MSGVTNTSTLGYIRTYRDTISGGGTQGTTGAQGVTGIQGVTGPIGATGTQGATGVTGAQGATGIQGTNGQSSSYYNYRAETSVSSITTPPPSLGRIMWNTTEPNQISATSIYIRKIDDDGADISVLLGLVNVGDEIILQSKNNSSDYQIWDIIGIPILAPGSVYVEWNVSLSLTPSSFTHDFYNLEPMILIINNIGPIGATGVTGAVGAVGSTGVTGAIGAVGATGVTGAVGAVGATGVTGAVGAVGATGVTGAVGAVGTTGVTGAIGAVGSTGVTGAIGAVGATGVTGAIGAVGATGVTGAIGAVGATGVTGAVGAVGSTGVTGAVGAVGATGVTGAVGAVGSTGVTGAVGAVGATGVTGAVGAVGATGVTGAVGAVGATGVTGAVGAVGATGVTGADGAVGATGVTGADGAVGSTGVTGADGAVGATGVTGAVGAVGATGVTGPVGPLIPANIEGQYLVWNGSTWVIGTDSAYLGVTNLNLGALALDSLPGTTGTYLDNTAVGYNAMTNSTSGNENTAIGSSSCANTTGNSNVGLGKSSLMNNISGSYNVALGSAAMGLNTSGDGNIVIGYNSQILGTSSNSNVIGYNVTGQGSNTTVIKQLRNADGTAIPIPDASFSNYVHYNPTTYEVTYIPEVLYITYTPYTLPAGASNQQLTLVNHATGQSGYAPYPRDALSTSGGVSGGSATVYALDVNTSTNEIYVGGNFTLAGPTPTAVGNIFIASQDGFTIVDTMGSGFTTGDVLSIFYDSTSGLPYAGGSFSASIASLTLNYISYYSGGAWQIMGSNSGNTPYYGLSGGYVNAMTKYIPGGSSQFVAVGGSFTSGSGVTLNQIAAYDPASDIFSPFTGLLQGVSSVVYATLYDPNSNSIYVGGSFSYVAGGVQANNIARFHLGTNTWYGLIDSTTLVNGVNGPVYALTLDIVTSGQIYVGGSFSISGGIATSNISIWNGGSNWSKLSGSSGDGVGGNVYAILNTPYFPQYVFVGGSFNDIDSGTIGQVGNIAVYYNSAWYPIYFSGGLPAIPGNQCGFDNVVYALNFDNYLGSNYLIAGGAFTQSYDGNGNTTTINYIGNYSVTFSSSWSVYGNGNTTGGALNGTVRAIAVDNNYNIVYAGGDFTTDNDTGNSLYNIAYYLQAGMNWYQMDSSTPGTSGTGSVYALAFDSNSNNTLWVGGTFLQMGANAQSYIAEWYGTTSSGSSVSTTGQWTTASFYPGEGTNTNVYALNVSNYSSPNTILCIGGQFTQITSAFASTDVNRITYGTYNSSNPATNNSWLPLSSSSNGIGGTVYALEYVGSDLYVGGNISQVHTVSGINNIVKWVGLSPSNGYWEPILYNAGYGVNGIVRALESTGSDIYVGGDFTTTGSGFQLNYIGKWNGTWSQITYSTDVGLNSPVYALSFRSFSSEILIGGSFTGTQNSLLSLSRVGSCSTSGLLFNQVIDANYAGTNGQVNTVLANGTYRYVGGNFSNTLPISGAILNSMAVIYPPYGSLVVNGTFSDPYGGTLASITLDYYDETTHLIYDSLDAAWLLANGPYSAPIPPGTFWADYLYWNNSTSKWTVGSDAVRIGRNSGQFGQYGYSVAIGYEAANTGQTLRSVAIGYQSAASYQGGDSIAIGTGSGQYNQGAASIALGWVAGQYNQGANTIAMGYQCGFTGQGQSAIAIGTSSGTYTQGQYGIAIGTLAGQYNQKNYGLSIGFSPAYTGQNSWAVALGPYAGYLNQGSYSVAIGYFAGYTAQGSNSVAIGYNAGASGQKYRSIAIGENAGYSTQGISAVAIGVSAGSLAQGSASIAIGISAGYNNQSSSAVSIGSSAGFFYQQIYSVAIGYQAGYFTQGTGSIAIGYQAGQTQQNNFSVAVGYLTGASLQGQYSVAMGYQAGFRSQGFGSVAIGYNSGSTQQNQQAVAIGQEAGTYTQGTQAVAIGYQAGTYSQGTQAVAIGFRAGYTQQGSFAIAMGTNAGGTGQTDNAVAIGREAGWIQQGQSSVAVGYLAGSSLQGAFAVAIGNQAGYTKQGASSVAVGYAAGGWTQANNAVAVGREAGSVSQQTQAVAIGFQAGYSFQGTQSVAVGALAGSTRQSQQTVAIGYAAGGDLQGTQSVAIGYQAASTRQSQQSVAIGWGAAAYTQGTQSIAIGYQAGSTRQGSASIAVGFQAGAYTQSANAVAVGYQSGAFTQGIGAVAIGYQAGYTQQGNHAVAIGNLAGQTNQTASSIVLNASGTVLNSGVAGFFVNPIRNVTQTTALGYNASTSEVTYYSLIGAGAASGVTVNSAAQTLTVNFNGFFQGNTSYALTTGATGTTTITTFSFSGAVSSGNYTIIISITGTAAATPTLSITPTASTTNRCNFTSISVVVTGATTPTQTNPKYIILTVAYDGTNYYISGSGFNN